jgi:hypothetical protein
MSGFFGESKIDILRLIPAEYLPKTLFFEANADEKVIQAAMEKIGLNYPIIAKPNIGERGNLVARTENEQELWAHIQKMNADFILQEYVDFPVELGVLYYRFPEETKGQISSITIKDFMQVKGDGLHTIEEIMEADLRYRFQIARFRRLYPELLRTVLGQGEVRLLEPIGNHCRGTKFLNGNHLITPELNHIFDKISEKIEGFYYGRFDLRVKSTEDLYAGQNIRILELNGISADPAHIYDPQFPIFKAYRDLAHHFGIMGKISRQNHKKGVPYTSTRELARRVYQYFWAKK